MIVRDISQSILFECLIIHISELLGIIRSSLDPAFHWVTKLITSTSTQITCYSWISSLIIVSGSRIKLCRNICLLYNAFICFNPSGCWISGFQSFQSVLFWTFQRYIAYIGYPRYHQYWSLFNPWLQSLVGRINALPKDYNDRGTKNSGLIYMQSLLLDLPMEPDGPQQRLLLQKCTLQLLLIWQQCHSYF